MESLRIVARRTPTRVRLGSGIGLEVRLEPDDGVAIGVGETITPDIVDPGHIGDGNPRLMRSQELVRADPHELLAHVVGTELRIKLDGVTDFDARALQPLAKLAAERGQVVTIELA